MIAYTVEVLGTDGVWYDSNEGPFDTFDLATLFADAECGESWRVGEGTLTYGTGDSPDTVKVQRYYTVTSVSTAASNDYDGSVR